MLVAEMTFTEEASRKLSVMKGRTRLTPNILARFGFCLSLEDPETIDVAQYEPQARGHVSIKWHVLTGAYESLFEALLRERCYQDGTLDEDRAPLFRAHMNRGVLLLDKNLKSLERLLYVLPKETRSADTSIQSNGHE